jgi:hypothetical protein
MVMICSSVVGIVASYRLDDQEVRVLVMEGSRIFNFSSYPIGTGSKTAAAQS